MNEQHTYVVLLLPPPIPFRGNRAEFLRGKRRKVEEMAAHFLDTIKKSNHFEDLVYGPEVTAMDMFYFKGSEDLAEIAREMPGVRSVFEDGATLEAIR